MIVGLDVSHGCWQGAYSAFNRWRCKISELAGYGYHIYDSDKTPSFDWSSVPYSSIHGEWDVPPKDPILVLLAHSDCDGVIKAEHTGPLADRLESLLPLLPEGNEFEDGGGHIGNWRDKTQQFIDGLRQASELQEDVEFY